MLCAYVGDTHTLYTCSPPRTEFAGVGEKLDPCLLLQGYKSFPSAVTIQRLNDGDTVFSSKQEKRSVQFQLRSLGLTYSTLSHSLKMEAFIKFVARLPAVFGHHFQISQ